LIIAAGGCVLILIGAVLFTILITWKDGRALVLNRLEQDALPIELFIKSISMGDATKFVPGEAIFQTGSPSIVPHAMLHNIKHNKVLHERNILVTVITRDIPFVAKKDRIQVETLSKQIGRAHV